MSTTEDACDCTFFDEGDYVESRLNPTVWGIVVTNSDFGRYVTVQMAGTLEIRQFFAVTLQHTGAGGAEPPDQAEEPSNVIRVDFTKPRELRETTKTVGEA